METRTLKQAVRRNLKRFLNDFMFVLTKEEWKNLRSQFVTSSSHEGIRYLPMAFTEKPFPAVCRFDFLAHGAKYVKAPIELAWNLVPAWQ